MPETRKPAITCHKAQGGEWDRVIIDVSTLRTQRGIRDPRWLYTAMTRARRELGLVGWGSAITSL